MNETGKPTPGATRTAKEVIRKWFMRPISTSEEDIAKIIDEETGLRELLEAAKELAGAMNCGAIYSEHRAKLNELRAAIARAERKNHA